MSAAVVAASRSAARAEANLQRGERWRARLFAHGDVNNGAVCARNIIKSPDIGRRLWSRCSPEQSRRNSNCELQLLLAHINPVRTLTFRDRAFCLSVSVFYKCNRHTAMPELMSEHSRSRSSNSAAISAPVQNHFDPITETRSCSSKTELILSSTNP